MEGKYPIMIDGALMGTLEVTKKGAMTVFHARCRMVEGILRLSVYGEGGEGYLGVMMPEEGELRLTRSLSPMAMRGFPVALTEAGPAGMGQAEASPKTEEERDDRQKTLKPEKEGQSEEQQSFKEEKTPPEQTVQAERGIVPESMEGLCWYSSPDGALVSFDGERSLIALPVGDGRIPGNIVGERRSIEGREYMLYVSKNGRIQQ